MLVAGSQGNHRKTFAVKRHDGEPLTRTDLQYDLLYYLFDDKRAVFTDPHSTLSGEPAGSKVTFRNLYVNALVHSPRCSKVSRDKLLDSPQFADEFAKISLLSNVGRINTTMAFFPEMRTALRTYHPVPSLQKTDGNLQDAPRIKNILKASLLSTEVQNTPANLAEVLARSRGGIVPPTSIVNLVFVFASHSSMLTQSHFPPLSNFELLDFFSPINVSSESRARAFLWLCYHYYEAPTTNPFDDEYSRGHPGLIPALEALSAEEALLENLDTPEEKARGEKLTEQRRQFMEAKDKMLPTSEASGSQEPDTAALPPKEKLSRRGQGKGRSRGRGRGGGPRKTHSSLREIVEAKPSRQSSLSFADDASFQSITPDHNMVEDTLAESSRTSRHKGADMQDRSLSPDINHQQSLSRPRFPSPPKASPRQMHRHHSHSHPHQSSSTFIEPYPPRRPEITHLHTELGDGLPIRNKRRASTRVSSLSRQALPLDSYRDGSLPPLSISSPPPLDMNSNQSFVSHRRPTSLISFNGPSMTFPPVPPPARTMLEQAWHVVTNTDPLDDSDDEPDESTRLDLLLRLKIINRLRGKEPTPEPEPLPVVRQPEPVRPQRAPPRSRAPRR